MSKILFLSVFLTSPFVFGKECKILRNDGVVLYGNCILHKEKVIFESCIKFTCIVPSSITRSLDKGEEACRGSESILIESIKEHGSFEKIPSCRYSD